MPYATDLITKVGGGFAVVGMLIGAWLWSSTTCSTPPFTTERSCSNFLGEVTLDAVGSPQTGQLMVTGAFVGAVIGLIVGVVVGWVAGRNGSPAAAD